MLVNISIIFIFKYEIWEFGKDIGWRKKSWKEKKLRK